MIIPIMAMKARTAVSRSSIVAESRSSEMLPIVARPWPMISNSPRPANGAAALKHRGAGEQRHGDRQLLAARNAAFFARFLAFPRSRFFCAFCFRALGHLRAPLVSAANT